MIAREEFERYLSTLVSEEEKEGFKKQAKTNSIVARIMFILASVFGGIGIVLIFVPLGMMIAPMMLFFALVFVITGVLFLVFKNHGAYKELENKHKEDVIAFLMKGMEYSYDRSDYIPESVYRKAQLSRNYDTYTGEDLIGINIANDDGSRSETDLIISDIKTTKTETDNEGKSHTVTKYSGVLGYVEFPSEFKCRMTINRGSYALLQGLDKVKLESIEFNKKFSVRCTDQIEARYILTTDMMTKLLAIYEKESNFQMVLDGKNLFITIPGKNLFRVKAKSENVDGGIFYLFYEDVSLLLSIVNEIKKNNKVFKI